MCEVLEKYMTEAREEGREEGLLEANITSIVKMLALDMDEALIKELFPKDFEAGKQKFLETKN